MVNGIYFFKFICQVAINKFKGTIYEIVNNLSELQQITEKNLYNERNRISTEYSSKPTKKQNDQKLID